MGRALAWLMPLLVAICFGLVLARYLFGVASIAVQEVQLWLHSLLFMLGIAYALRHDAHVRVDILHARLGARGRAVVELLGVLLLLLPFCLFTFWISLDYVAESWRIGERSREPGGLPALWLLKALIPATAVLTALQGLARALHALAELRSSRVPP